MSTIDTSLQLSLLGHTRNIPNSILVALCLGHEQDSAHFLSHGRMVSISVRAVWISRYTTELMIIHTSRADCPSGVIKA
jgi:hypothetical protein